MATATLRPPPTGLCYWPLVVGLKDRLNLRVPLSAKLVEVDCDCLLVQIGPGSPYRLLVICGEPDGLLRMQLWEVGKRLKVVAEEKVLSDLVAERLKVWAEEHKLS